VEHNGLKAFSSRVAIVDAEALRYAAGCSEFLRFAPKRIQQIEPLPWQGVCRKVKQSLEKNEETEALRKLRANPEEMMNGCDVDGLE
jgi:hypothetical protein